MCNFEEHRCDFFRFITSYATYNSSLYFYYMRAFLQEGRLKGLKIIHAFCSISFVSIDCIHQPSLKNET